jgi:hypothetical protein
MLLNQTQDQEHLNIHVVYAAKQLRGRHRPYVVIPAMFWYHKECMGMQEFFTPDRDIGSAIFVVWVLVQSGILSCDSTVNTD